MLLEYKRQDLCTLTETEEVSGRIGKSKIKKAKNI